MREKTKNPRRRGHPKGVPMVHRPGPKQRREVHLTVDVAERLAKAAAEANVSVSVFTDRFLDQHLPPLSQEGATPSDQGEAAPPANAA